MLSFLQVKISGKYAGTWCQGIGKGILPVLLALSVICGPSALNAQNEDRVFIFNIGDEPNTFDPAKSTAINASVVQKNIFEGLTRPMPDGTPEPAAAESWEISDDGLTYTFKIREGLKWSNGEPVTAHDWVYSWTRALKPETAGEYAYSMYMMKGAKAFNAGEAEADTLGFKALDDLTLQVELEGPTPYFLTFLDHANFLPVHQPVVEGNERWSREAETFVSNGPYRVTKIASGQRIETEVNPHFRRADEIGLRKIHYRMIQDPATELLEYQNGRIHSNLTGGTLADMRRLREEGILKTEPNFGTYFVCFNTTEPPFDKLEVRKAFTLAVNRRLITSLVKNGSEPAFAFVPPGVPTPDGDDYRDYYGNFIRDSDIAGAKRALAAAGFPDGKGLPSITYIYNTNDVHKQIAEILQQQWEQILGAKVRLQNLEWKVLIDARTKGNFQFTRHGWIGDYRDPLTFLDMWLSDSGNNDAQWKNEEYDALIEEARRTVDAQERLDLLFEAEEILLDNYIVCPIYYYAQNYYLSDEVEGIERSVLMTTRFDRARWKN